MNIKPIYEDVSCAPLGYDDVTVRVRINPPGAMVREYWDAHKAIITALADGNLTDEIEGAFEDAMVELVESVTQGDETILIDSREALNGFGDEYDIHIIRYGLQRLWDVRNDRVSSAVDRFRSEPGQLPVQKDGATAG